MLARPEVQSYEYSFAGSITLALASGVGHCLGQPQLRGERRFERPRRGTEDQGRCSREKRWHRWTTSPAGSRRSAWSSPPRTTLSSLAGRLNDGRPRDGEAVANLETEMRKL
jgi:hypothetical protein